MANYLTAVLTPDVVGLLDRNITVALVEISRGGCLLETSSAIAPGTVATLSVEIGDVAYSDHVIVARCSRVPGGGQHHHVGVEFLPLERPGHLSLRLYAAALGAHGLKFTGPAPVRWRPNWRR